MICTIHQPNFFPWYPFFQKMQNADVFVFLTECQYEKNGFQNRFNIGKKWYTMSVQKGMVPIKDKLYKAPLSDWIKIKTSLPQYRHILDRFNWALSPWLGKNNIGIISTMCRMLDMNTKLMMDFPTDKKGTDRLIEICKRYECDTYLSGSSGKKYLDIEKFKRAGIRVIYQDPSGMIQKPIIEVLSERF